MSGPQGLPARDSRGSKDDARPRFADQGLLDTALTHMSAEGFAASRAISGSNSWATACSACRRRHAVPSSYPQAEEGDMSRRLADLVRKETCAEVAARLESRPALMRLGEGEILGGARKNKAILADACEAIIGAVFIDGGYEAARALVERSLRRAPAEAGDGRCATPRPRCRNGRRARAIRPRPIPSAAAPVPTMRRSSASRRGSSGSSMPRRRPAPRSGWPSRPPPKPSCGAKACGTKRWRGDHG